MLTPSDAAGMARSRTVAFFQTKGRSSGNHLLAIEVDEFEAVFRRLAERDLFENEGFYSKMYEMPDGAVQIHLIREGQTPPK